MLGIRVQDEQMHNTDADARGGPGVTWGVERLLDRSGSPRARSSTSARLEAARREQLSNSADSTAAYVRDPVRNAQSSSVLRGSRLTAEARSARNVFTGHQRVRTR